MLHTGIKFVYTNIPEHLSVGSEVTGSKGDKWI
jgi:hypothetical protein